VGSGMSSACSPAEPAIDVRAHEVRVKATQVRTMMAAMDHGGCRVEVPDVLVA